MRIAVTFKEGRIFEHFGHTQRFKIYDIENNEIKLATTVNTNKSSHGALPDILKKLKVDSLICGGIGDGAKRALAEAGIELYGGVCGDADKAVEALLSGNLKHKPNAVCPHQGEHRGGNWA